MFLKEHFKNIQFLFNISLILNKYVSSPGVEPGFRT